MKYFKDFDFTDFWDDNKYALKEYVNELPSDELIKAIEKELGYKLPNSYIELMKLHNGGIPNNTCFPTDTETSWAVDHVAITGIFGIGRDKQYSLCGSLGSSFMIEEWGYPEIGICVCDCPSAGHDMVMLDYRECGREGEPKVVHVDQEDDYKITFMADNFEAFIKGLVNESVYDTSEEDLQNDLKIIEKGKFSKLLNKLVSAQRDIDFESVIRKLCKKIALTKKYFSLHADEDSYLLYDVQFFLYSKCEEVKSDKSYLEIYPQIIAMADAEFSTGGYAPDFVKDWLKTRIKQNQINKTTNGLLQFEEKYEKELWEKLTSFL